jgi:glucokinase
MKLGAIGVACAGNISLDGTVLASANFGSSWRGFHLRDELRKLFNSPIIVENDANAAALAEHRELGRRSQLLRTSPGFSLLIGTGLGTGMINDRGFLERGATGRAVELGHIQLALKWKTSVNLVTENITCGCGDVGCVEQYTALGYIQRELTAREPSNPTHPLYQIEDRREAAKQVLSWAVCGDLFCLSIILDQAANLGMFVSHLIGMHDPAYVLIGGGITEADEKLKALYLQQVIDQVDHRLGVERRKELVFGFTALGDNAGWVGATISASELLQSLAKDSVAWPI